ncbi:hypothetical protein BDN70DRAFT_820546, partial [Pholiota conissans]
MFDACTDVDPLYEFGTVNGQLPGRTPEECLELHNVILHWSLPHNQFLWEDLPSAVETFVDYKFTSHDLIPYDQQDTTFYTVHPARLLSYGHIIVALSQVLQGLVTFLHEENKTVFTIDPGFAMLRLLAWHDNPMEMVLTVPVLQERSKVALRHSKKLFNRVRRQFLTFDEAQSVSSYNSSNADERDGYLTNSPLSLVTKFALRRD